MAKIKHIAIFTESPAKLAQFYTEVFGMTVTDTIGDRAVWITDGYVDLALLHRRHEKMPKASITGVSRWTQRRRTRSMPSSARAGSSPIVPVPTGPTWKTRSTT
jgi:catechol-2,3-dioxygenase